MASVTSLGTGSGIDLEGILTKLMAVETLPLTALVSKQASYKAKLSAFGSLQSALSTLQSTAKTLANASTYTGVSSTVSDPTILSASVGSTAATGSYSIAVGQLAQGQVLRSNTNFAATTDTFTTGSIDISVGGATATSITIDGSNNTLAGIRDAINAADAGVTASIINDGSTNRLMLSSDTTGATAGAITVSVTDAGSGGSHALSVLDDASLIEVREPLDARFSVNGLDITRSDNKVSDAIEGLTLTLVKAGTLSSPLTTQITLSKNTAQVQSAITGMVTAYNTVVAQIKAYTAYNSESETASVLTGDSTLRSIQSQLSSLIGGKVSGLSGGISRLSDLGVALQKDGTLKTDLTKLQAALADGNVDVAGLFNSTATNNEGLATRISGMLDGFIGSNGLIAARTQSLDRTIKDYGKQQETLSFRLAKIESRYRAQFSALDATIGNMQQTQSYLTQQLDYIKALTTGN